MSSYPTKLQKYYLYFCNNSLTFDITGLGDGRLTLYVSELPRGCGNP